MSFSGRGCEGVSASQTPHSHTIETKRIDIMKSTGLLPWTSWYQYACVCMVVGVCVCVCVWCGVVGGGLGLCDVSVCDGECVCVYNVVFPFDSESMTTSV